MFGGPPGTQWRVANHHVCTASASGAGPPAVSLDPLIEPSRERKQTGVTGKGNFLQHCFRGNGQTHAPKGGPGGGHSPWFSGESVHPQPLVLCGPPPSAPGSLGSPSTLSPWFSGESVHPQPLVLSVIHPPQPLVHPQPRVLCGPTPSAHGSLCSASTLSVSMTSHILSSQTLVE